MQSRRGQSDDPAAKPAGAGSLIDNPPPDARFASSFDQIAVGIAYTTIDGKILACNRKLGEMLGYSTTELLGMTTRDLTHPEDRDQQDRMRRELLGGTRNHFSGDKRYLRKDGSDFWVSRSVALAQTPDGDPYLIQTIDNIDDRKHAEASLLRLNRARRVMAACSHVLAHASSETDMLNNMCSVVVGSGGYRQAWIGVPSGDADSPLHVIACAGYGKDRPMSASGTWAADGQYQGAAGTALASGRIFILRDILNNELHARVQARAKQYGYQSSAALPLPSEGKTAGVLVLHAAERDAFDEEEIRLLHELSVETGFGMTKLRARESQQLAEQRSRDNEKRFREVFEQAAVGITRVDLEGRLAECNQKFCDLLGYSREELLGKPMREITHPEDYGSGAQYRMGLAKGAGSSHTSEKRFIRKDGSPLWVRRTMSTATDAAGNPQYVISMVEDITGHKELEQHHRATIDNAPVGIMHTAIDSYQILRVNPKLCEMLGYNEAELMQMTSTQIVHPDYQFKDRSRYRELIQTENAPPFSSERKFVRKDGSVFWGNRSVSMVRDASGKPLYHLRIIEDITERKHAEEVLVRERALLRTIIDTIPDHIYAKDKNGTYMIANRNWLDARGAQDADVSGKTVNDFFPPKVAEILARQDRDIVQTGKPVQNPEHKLMIEHGENEPAKIRWGSTRKVPLRTSSGEIIGTVGISRDITEEKDAAVRRAMSHTVTQILSESTTVTEAMQQIIRNICEMMQWSYGARWSLDEKAQRMVRSEYWCETEPEFDPADRENWLWSLNVKTGRFLGHVWNEKEPIWLSNLHDDKPFRRRPSAIKLGWDSAYAFPILIGGEVVGVMEFFGPTIRKPELTLVQTTVSIGSQIGQFIQRKQAEDKLNFLARFDTVTSLPNRYLFTDRLGQVVAQAGRNDWTSGVLFIDLDRFKAVNDTFGHAAGDELLRQAAARMQSCIRGSDTVGRLSGDEFGVMLSNLAKTDDAGVVAQKIVESLSAPFNLNGHQAYISASVGIALYPGDGRTPDELLKNADTAMYRTKSQGRNGYQFYLPQMNERLIQRQRLESQLRSALEHGEFLMHYQPKAELAGGAITGFEALLRWKSSEGLVPPADFIAVLEETGLIVPVGDWILNSVCAQLKQWEQDGVPLRPIAVNLSARQFQVKNLAETVSMALRRHHVSPALLKLELTESLLMSDAQESVATLHQLKHLGVQLSVDDFGTGYSSLAYLKRFPLDELKIDREFIRDAVSDPDDAAIVVTIINLAHSLKLRVVAEGLETEGQLNFLRFHHCDEIQGYYFSQPLPAEQCAQLLHEGKSLPQTPKRASRDSVSLLLVVENEQEMQLLTRAFTPGGFDVIKAKSAEQGFEILARQRIDVVISDNDMTGMSGIQFLARVRKLYANTLRILASSGDDTPTLTRATNMAGIHLFLPKSWTAERLCTEVRDTLQMYLDDATSSGPHPLLRSMKD